MNVKLTQEQKIKVINGADLAEIMQKVLKRENKIDRNKEHLWVVCMNTHNRILLIELVSLGTVNAVPVEAMEIFSFALQKQAVKIILVHNHPSGDIEPSSADKIITDKMVAIGDFLKCPVIDHLIVTETDFYSFVESGLMEQIKQQSSFDLTFAKQAKLKEQLYYLQLQAEEAVKKAEEKAKKDILKTKQEMALKQLNDGLLVEAIVKYTGLTLKQVEALKKKN